MGRTIEEEHLPHRDLSIAAAGYRSGVPVTCHVTIGADIIHAHPNCDGAALGATSYRDFLLLANAILGFAHEPIADGGSRIADLEDLPTEQRDKAGARLQSAIQNRQSKIENPSGVFLDVGSAVTGPEVYLKALSMARNIAHQRGQQIRRFVTAVFDLVPLPDPHPEPSPSGGRGGWHEEPPKDEYRYYYRPTASGTQAAGERVSPQGQVRRAQSPQSAGRLQSRRRQLGRRTRRRPV